MRRTFLLIWVLTSACTLTLKANQSDNLAYINDVLGEIRSEGNIVRKLARTGTQIKKSEWRGRSSLKRLDQLLFSSIEEIAKDSLKRHPNHNIDYGSVFSPAVHQSSNVSKDTFTTIQKLRQKEFISLCMQVGELQPDLALRIAGHLVKLAETQEDYGFEDAWTLVDYWLNWSLQQSPTETLYLLTSGHQGHRYLDLQNSMTRETFIAYVGSSAHKEKELQQYLEKYRQKLDPNDSKVRFALSLWSSTSNLYCASPNDIPQLVTETYKSSFQKQLRFRHRELITLLRKKQYPPTTLFETAKKMSKTPYAPYGFYEFCIKELSKTNETVMLDSLITIICEKSITLPNLVFSSRDKDLTDALVKYQYDLVEASIALGEKCIATYKLGKPHQFHRPSEIRRLGEIILKNKDSQKWKDLGSRLLRHHSTCRKKFEHQKWYKESPQLKKLLKELQ